MKLATILATMRAAPDRAETLEAAPVEPVAAGVEPVLVPVADPVWETAELDPLPVVGVKGAVIPYPGSLALGTLAAKAAKVLSPVVGGLMEPYMPPLQC
jgi:hypothetical protein